MIAYALFTAVELEDKEPKTFGETIQSSRNWKAAMDKEMQSLKKNKTWVLVDKPKKQKVVDCKWISKLRMVLLRMNPRDLKLIL